MNQPLPNIRSREWGWDNIRRDVFQLIAWSYQLMAQEICKCEMEEDITGLLRKGINQIFDEMDDTMSMRFQFYSAHNEDPIDDSKLGKARPRIDITIECSGHRPRKRFRLEAKRCARRKFNSKYTIGWYLEGITTFVNGQYANDSPEGGMLGLMQSDDAPYWKNELLNQLQNDLSLSCCSPFLTDTDPIQDLPEISVSAHRRADNSTINLYHIFLNCI